MTRRCTSSGRTFRRPTWSLSSALRGSQTPAAARPQGRNRGVGAGALERAGCDAARAPGGYCQGATVQQRQCKPRLPALCGAVLCGGVGGAAAGRGCARAAAPSATISGVRFVVDADFAKRRSFALLPKRASVPAPPAAKPQASAGGCIKSWPTSSGQWRRYTKFDASTWPKWCCSPWRRACRSRMPSPRPWLRQAADLCGGGATSRCGEETYEQQPQHQRGRGRRKRPCSGAGHFDAAREVHGVAPAEPCLVAHAAARAAVRPLG